MSRGFDDLYCFFIVNNIEACTCYSALDKKDEQTNHFIESIAESLITNENKYKNIRETRIVKWAKINLDKSNLFYVDLDLKSRELIFNLSFIESKNFIKKINLSSY